MAVPTIQNAASKFKNLMYQVSPSAYFSLSFTSANELACRSKYFSKIANEVNLTLKAIACFNATVKSPSKKAQVFKNNYCSIASHLDTLAKAMNGCKNNGKVASCVSGNVKVSKKYFCKI